MVDLGKQDDGFVSGGNVTNTALGVVMPKTWETRLGGAVPGLMMMVPGILLTFFGLNLIVAMANIFVSIFENEYITVPANGVTSFAFPVVGVIITMLGVRQAVQGWLR